MEKLIEKEKLKVWIKLVDGRPECVCLRTNKLCKRNCEKDTLSRVDYSGWKACFRQDKYGKSKI